MKKKILVLCGYERDERELSAPYFSEQYDIIFEQSSKHWLFELCNTQKNNKDIVAIINTCIDDIVALCQNYNIDGIVSTSDYPANILRVAIAEKQGLPAPSLESVLLLEHKYYSRKIQKKLAPEAVLPFYLIKKDDLDIINIAIPFPIMLKPVKSSFSRNAFIIDSHETLQKSIKNTFLRESFLKLFNYLLYKHTSCRYDACTLIAETLAQGYQTTVDGFIFEGEVTILGIIDSIMFPGTISFERFEYPSLLLQGVQERMSEVVKRVMKGSGLDNSLFNVECIYNPETDEIHIIEVNPRISSQFADIYERVDGFNTYKVLLDLAVGKRPEIKKGKGKFTVAASFVLRLFSDCYVEKVPSLSIIQTVHELFPDIRLEIYAKPGAKLSEYEQDGKSFRYGLIHLGGYDRDDLMNRYDICKQLLEFKFREL